MKHTSMTNHRQQAGSPFFFDLKRVAATSILAIGLCGSLAAQEVSSAAVATPDASAAASAAAPEAAAGGVSSSVPAPDVIGLPESPGAGLRAPQATPPAAAPDANSDKPSKRILFIIPNARAVAAGSTLPPQTVHEKFTTAFADTVDPANFVLSALVAAYDYGRGSTPEFGSGGVAFGRYYWHSLADQSIENTSVEFLVPVLTHEDTRYYTLGHGGVRKRIVYSLSRVVITRSDSGKETVNLGEILGAGLASGVSSRYYPASQRDAGSMLDSYALNLGIDAASYVLREFDEDLARKFSRKK